MSDYHIRTMAEDKKTVNAVFHIPVPASGTNDAGILWRSAIVMDQGGADEIESVLSDISTAELNAMKAGALIETIERIRFSSTNLTNSERRAEVESAYGTALVNVISEKQATLVFMGYAGEVI